MITKIGAYKRTCKLKRKGGAIRTGGRANSASKREKKTRNRNRKEPVRILSPKIKHCFFLVLGIFRSPIHWFLYSFLRREAQMQEKRGGPYGRRHRSERRVDKKCLPPPQPYPWLLYFIEGGKNQTYCDISVPIPTKTYSTSIPDFGSSRLCAVQHGWCLFAKCWFSRLFLWNPYNLKIIKLPFLETNCFIKDFVLSSSPTSKDQTCTIFLFSSSYGTSIFYYCQLGDEQWTEVNFYKDIMRALAMKGKSPLKDEVTYLTNPVYCNGCLYVNIQTKYDCLLAVFEKLQPNGLKINPTLDFMPMLRAASSSLGRITQFLGSNDELFRIEILQAHDKVVAVAIYKFDSSQRAWEKVESIKDRVFFISRDFSSFACQATNLEGGRIYIALDNFVCIYSIKDNSVVISQPFSNLPKEQSYSTWFMPDIGNKMIDTLKEETGKAHQIREKGSLCGAIHSKETWDKAFNEYALPLDVVEMIAKRLFNVLDYLHFRATDRCFRLAAPPVQWRSSSSMSMSRFDDLSLSPLFVFSENNKVFTFVHPKHGLRYKYIINLPEINVDGEFWNLMSDCEICHSKDGWLLIAAVNTRFSFFFNPFTKEVLPLAFGYGSIRNTQCVGCSHSPISSKCVIIELDKFEPLSYMTAYINCRGLKFEDIKFPLRNISPIFHNGLFYYLSIKGNLAVMKVTEGKASWKEFKEPQAPCSGYFNNFLVECDGNLLSVFEGPFGKWVQVFKLNESKMTWMKVERLENHMLFVGNTSSFSAVSTIPGMGNKIYFPRFYGQSVLFYSLETNNYHTFENEVVDFHHVREHLNCSWIEPRWH